ncbi:outer membrane protein assembly factor BamE [Geothrix sp. 21YS21S-4]|uniref:outer membrane protein assembly factor BamE domain-containing protein n=1 Tax=Geothrix sp. 21YS21S-4 TaxID=3068889 RepID=UPI0027B93ADE|nr:outer membrane protein assembly factor BamE [Geothrix sp. 21YS21S-4]
MRRHPLILSLAVPFALMVGCVSPDMDVAKIRIGMTKKEVIERVGSPSRISTVNDTDVYEYEAYDRYGAIKINSRSRYIRLVNGKVDAFGTREDLQAGRAAQGIPAKGVFEAQPAPVAPAAFDLRTELEKLEKLKKDGLISEDEFKDLRHKVLDKAKAQ